MKIYNESKTASLIVSSGVIRPQKVVDLPEEEARKLVKGYPFMKFVAEEVKGKVETKVEVKEETKVEVKEEPKVEVKEEEPKIEVKKPEKKATKKKGNTKKK